MTGPQPFQYQRSPAALLDWLRHLAVLLPFLNKYYVKRSFSKLGGSVNLRLRGY